MYKIYLFQPMMNFNASSPPKGARARARASKEHRVPGSIR
jgi:hypothetical protein